jgi:nucleotidyltransferase/DNA polymerase involved in DNA repair
MFATILLPNFYLQSIARHQPKLRKQPLAILDATAIKAVILQLNEAAENEGVRAGMTPSQALARCLHLVIKARARDCEQQLSDILLHHAFMLSPFVEATASGVCTVQFMQSNRLTIIKERLSLSEPSALRSQRPDCRLRQKLRHVIDLLARCDLVARAGIAQNADASFLAAHRAEPVLEVKEAKEFLAPLPIETLTVEARF